MSMLQLTERLGPIAAAEADDSLTLRYDDRIKGRLRVTLDSGREAGLFLDRGPVLRHADGLLSTDGSRAGGDGASRGRIALGAPVLSPGQSPCDPGHRGR